MADNPSVEREGTTEVLSSPHSPNGFNSVVEGSLTDLEYSSRDIFLAGFLEDDEDDMPLARKAGGKSSSQHSYDSDRRNTNPFDIERMVSHPSTQQQHNVMMDKFSSQELANINIPVYTNSFLFYVTSVDRVFLLQSF